MGDNNMELEMAAPLIWDQILNYKAQYENGQQIKKYPESAEYVESFVFPIKVVSDLIGRGAKDGYFAFGYHELSVGRVVENGITLVLFGIDEDNEVQLKPNKDVIWDSHKTPLQPDDIFNSTPEEGIDTLRAYSNGSISKFTTIHIEDDEQNVPFILKGIRIDLEELSLFLNRNNQVSYIECIMIYHEEQPDTIDQKGHSIAIIGLNDQKERLIATGVDRNSIDPAIDKAFDYCDPCPRVCPNFVNF